MSPTGVDVACALTCRTSAAAMPASRSAARIARTMPRPSGSRLDDVVAVGGHRRRRRAGRRPGRRGRPRGRPAPARSRRRPRRARSRPGPCRTGGTRARGSSLRVDMARIAANPAIGSGWMTASVPPATTTSARPERMMSRPQAIASAPVAQALAGACTPALAPSSRPDPGGRAVGHEHRHGVRADPPGAARLQDVVLVEQGHARRRCRVPTRPPPAARRSRSASPARRPPTPRGRRSAPVASDRSSRRSLTRSSWSDGSTASWAAMRTGSCAAHSWVSAPTPERPASMASQVDATSPPSGVVAPSPVTTTSCAAHSQAAAFWM